MISLKNVYSAVLLLSYRLCCLLFVCVDERVGSGGGGGGGFYYFPCYPNIQCALMCKINFDEYLRIPYFWEFGLYLIFQHYLMV